MMRQRARRRLRAIFCRREANGRITIAENVTTYLRRYVAKHDRRRRHWGARRGTSAVGRKAISIETRRMWPRGGMCWSARNRPACKSRLLMRGGVTSTREAKPPTLVANSDPATIATARNFEPRAARRRGRLSARKETYQWYRYSTLVRDQKLSSAIGDIVLVIFSLLSRRHSFSSAAAACSMKAGQCRSSASTTRRRREADDICGSNARRPISAAYWRVGKKAAGARPKLARRASVNRPAPSKRRPAECRLALAAAASAGRCARRNRA